VEYNQNALNQQQNTAKHKKQKTSIKEKKHTCKKTLKKAQAKKHCFP
jgi:hypothetical protein